MHLHKTSKQPQTHTRTRTLAIHTSTTPQIKKRPKTKTARHRQGLKTRHYSFIPHLHLHLHLHLHRLSLLPIPTTTIISECFFFFILFRCVCDQVLPIWVVSFRIVFYSCWCCVLTCTVIEWERDSPLEVTSSTLLQEFTLLLIGLLLCL